MRFVTAYFFASMYLNPRTLKAVKYPDTEFSDAIAEVLKELKEIEEEVEEEVEEIEEEEE